jgi:hypothetical protein
MLQFYIEKKKKTGQCWEALSFEKKNLVSWLSFFSRAYPKKKDGKKENLPFKHSSLP